MILMKTTTTTVGMTKEEKIALCERMAMRSLSAGDMKAALGWMKAAAEHKK